MDAPTLIEKKRDGAELTAEEIGYLIAGFTSGEIPEYQMSALAMAIFFQGMSPEETAALTRAMLDSGDVLRYPGGAPAIVDKHSTGGIGDKVSLILAPLLACDELWVPMISGRGLGITGGTLDKLESIPGFRVDLSQAEAIAQLERIGVVMMGQTAEICPADKKLYALRDVTRTVPSTPLIVASIMSKKLAESLDRLVLDVKFGSGAFMQSRDDAEELAAAMVSVGESMNVRTEAVLTPMEEPLGHAVGNALEVAEAIDCLQGRGPDDLRDLTLDLAAKVSSVKRDQLATWLGDGSAWKKFVQLAEAQGGDGSALEKLTSIHSAPVQREIPAPADGTLKKVDAKTVGLSSFRLGAGRSRTEDTIDFSVGFSGLAKCGSAIEKGHPLATVHARTEKEADEAQRLFLSGIEIS